jgi:transposase-like protein
MATIADTREHTALLLQTFQTVRMTVDYMTTRNLLPKARKCPKCRNWMSLSWDKPVKYRWRCSKCRKSTVNRIGSIFTHSRIPYPTVMMIILCFWIGIRITPCSFLTGGERHLVSKWYRNSRQAMATEEYFRETLLGGPGRVVEVDEAVFRKRKYNRGRRKKVIWILGFAERSVGEEEKCRVIYKVVKDRSAATLLPLIEKFIKPQTLIITDEWKSYHGIPNIIEKEYTHQTVCHKRDYVDPITGAYTNTVEGMWAMLRKWMPVNGVRKQFIHEYLWGFVYKHNTPSTFERLLETMRTFKQERLNDFRSEVLEQEEDTEEAEVGEDMEVEDEVQGDDHVNPPRRFEFTIPQDD